MQILCFGDSNTFGYDPRGYLGDRYDEKNRWVDLLASATGWQLINAGVNGREIPRNSNPLREFSNHPDADLFLIMLGTNDLLQGASASHTATQMEAFLSRLLPYRKQILLVSPPQLKRGAWVPEEELVAESVRLGEEYKRVAENLNIPFVDTRQWKIDLAFDGVHFTEDGHHTFAEHLIKQLR